MNAKRLSQSLMLVAGLSCMLVLGECMRVIPIGMIKQQISVRKDSEYMKPSYNKPSRRGGRSVVGPFWPTTTIPYAFNSFDNPREFSKSDLNKIRDAMKEIETSAAINHKNCLTFVARTNEPDYIFFVNQGTCDNTIGFNSGVNNVSLSAKCRSSKGQIIQQIMRKLGFDHEHSRADRDKHIKVVKTNEMEKKSNLKKNPFYDAPYDFHSVMHYDWITNDNSDPKMLSKFPPLVSDKNALRSSRDKLSPIDVHKIQTLYQCEAISVPEVRSDSIDEVRLANITKRFMTETKINDISEALAEKYLETSLRLCGENHFWPVHYPLVEDEHPLYKLMCTPKRVASPKDEWYGKCRFSVECDDREKSYCVRPFFKRRGYCSKLGGSVGQSFNDWLFGWGQSIKDGFTMRND